MGKILAYSSAKPQSGYTGAVRGYAQKMAKLLGYECDIVFEEHTHDAPAIAIGFSDAMRWDGAVPFALKARPYQDQHGYGPSMHPLTADMLSDVTPVSSVASIVIASPAWLVQQDITSQLNDWLAAHHVTQLNVSASPRTNPLLWDQLCEQWLHALDANLVINAWHPASGGENHYLKMLGESSLTLLLGTSRSIASEAAMFAAPIQMKGDDKENDDRFFAAAIQAGFAEDRFQRFNATQPVERKQFEAHDVTMGYVHQAVKEYHQWQQKVA